MSELSMTLIIIYVVVNMVWTIWMPFWLAGRFDTDWIDIAFPTYVHCSDAADAYAVNAVGEWAMTLVYTIFILPGLLFYYLTIGAAFLTMFIGHAVMELLSHVFKKE